MEMLFWSFCWKTVCWVRFKMLREQAHKRTSGFSFHLELWECPGAPGSATTVVGFAYPPSSLSADSAMDEFRVDGHDSQSDARLMCTLTPDSEPNPVPVYSERRTMTLRICAFNIQSFGDSKLSDEATSEVIVKILDRYDITLVQEVRDSDLSAVNKLLELLNSASKHSYSHVISEPLGRDSYKEMYLFIYRPKKVAVVDQLQYPNNKDRFSRPPFIVKFSVLDSEEEELILVPLHTPPNEAVAEIDSLYDVHLYIQKKWGTDNVMFLGDFNASCNYVEEKDWSSIRLRTKEGFQWLISDSVDTTVGKSDCAYDRIVVHGSEMKKWVKPNSAKVFDFQAAFKLSQEEALAVSDHFPVEVMLKFP
ncbi:deoxyribonuclease-1-like 2 [Tiliqua scincoides]|uniref:deoxyribonuclease-1-like 2 n=1 Tax=Tiliqua scincoides TaxID=71010 RepID=UPI003462382F